MNTSTYLPDDEQDGVTTEFLGDAEYYPYSDTQPTYTYQPTISYAYNTPNTYTSANVEPQYVSTQSSHQGTYSDPDYSQYEASSSAYVPEYSSYPTVSSSSDNAGGYGQSQLASSGPSGSMENWETFPGVTEEDSSYTTSEHRGTDQHSQKKSSSKSKHSKSGNMRTPRKHHGPPPELTSVFDVNPDSKSQRKSRKTFTEEEKKKVEAVRSIGACGPCRQNKRTVGLKAFHSVLTKLTRRI